MKKLYSTKSTLLTGTLFLTLAGILTRIIGFFYRIFLSRTIGAEGLGIYQLIAPVTAICFAFTAAGIQTSISKFVSMEVGRKNDAGAKTYLSIGLFISLCLSYTLTAFFSIIMRILLLFPGLVISGARRSLLCSPFPLSHAVSMPVSTVIIMV